MNPADLTPDQRRRVERVQLVGLLVLVTAMVGSRLLYKVMHVDGWSALTIFLVVVTLDVCIFTVLMARIYSLRPSEVARQGARSVFDDARGKVTKIKSYLRR